MIVVAIIAVLAAIVIPSYADYVRRARIADAIAPLAAMNVKMEQYFQDNRSYEGACVAGTIAPAPTSSPYFTYTCSGLSATTYTVTATGQGAMSAFKYQLQQGGARKTASVYGGWSGAGSNCWVLRKDGGC